MSVSRIVETQRLVLEAEPPLAGMYQLSPYVWQEDGRFRIAIRAVVRSENPDEKISSVYFGTSEDGRVFKMETTPGIAPSPGADCLGCEDPTVIRDEGNLHVLYSGYDGQHSRLLRASGTDSNALEKKGEVLPGQDRFPMAKEAAILKGVLGVRLLFEYAFDGASRIGEGIGDSIEAPMTLSASPILPREAFWDSWHLSPCDAVEWRGRRIFIYSGADRKTRWRIGWAELDESGRVVQRAKEPLISPFDLEGEDTDIAFASSVIVHRDEFWIYYSVADRSLYRSRVEIGTDGVPVETTGDRITTKE